MGNVALDLPFVEKIVVRPFIPLKKRANSTEHLAIQSDLDALLRRRRRQLSSLYEQRRARMMGEGLAALSSYAAENLHQYSTRDHRVHSSVPASTSLLTDNIDVYLPSSRNQVHEVVHIGFKSISRGVASKYS